MTAVVCDAARNRFRGLHLGIPDRDGARRVPCGGHDCGPMYDPEHRLVWAVYADWPVRVLRFEAASARFVEQPPQPRWGPSRI